VPGKPVGLVYLAVAAKGRDTTVERQHFDGDRPVVRTAALERALELLDSALD
jgi:nicotinamide mononucleotide (NMN) deamidase PncC